MNFFTVFIRHPILAFMVNLALVVTGLYAFFQLNVDSMPDLNIATISVVTLLDGASPSQVEVALSKPIEDAVASLSELDTLKSTSSVGRSEVNITFRTGKDPNVALDEVRSKVDTLINDFPQGTQRPTYGKYSSSDSPVLQLAVTGKRNLRELTDIAHFQIRDPLQNVSGVGQIQILGGQERTIQIELDMNKLVQYNLSVKQVQDAVVAQNAKVPGGYVTSAYNEYLVSQPGLINAVSDFGRVVVDRSISNFDSGSTDAMSFQEESIFLSQVAKVSDGAAELRSLARLNGQSTLNLSVTKTSDGNILKVAEGVRSAITDLKAHLPADIDIQVVQDNSVYIKDSVGDLMQHLYLGSLLASLTVLVFMGSFRLTVIAMVSIPVSLITTFALMWGMGYTLNYMTLLALTLAVGIVVDDAVVVLENIYRMLEEEGLSPFEAASKGLQEIAFAVIATTCSLTVLFLPLAFMPGTVGMYFRSWGITMAFAIMVSMMVSFTLTPVMCALLLKRSSGPQKVSWLTLKMQDAYVAVLRLCLRLRWLVLLLVLLTCIWGVYLLKSVGKEFLAQDDQSYYTVKLSFPKGWSLARISKELEPIESDLRALPHVQKVLCTIADTDITAVTVFIGMDSYAKRKPYTQFNSMSDARKALSRYQLVKPSVTQDGDAQFSFVVVGDELGPLEKINDQMLAKLRTTPGILDLDTSLVVAVPEVQVLIDPVRALALNVSPSDAAQAISVLIGGQKVTSFEESGRSYDVRMRLRAKDRQTPNDVLQVFVSDSGGKPVQLNSVADVSTTLAPSTIQRYQRKRMVELTSNLSPELTLEQAQDKAQAYLAELHPPAGYGPQDSGDSKLMGEAAIAAFQAFLLSVMFMYMVLASQFENLLDPLIILFTIPLSLPFALLSLVLSGMTLNLFSVLGLFLLFGVVKKNAILQIDRTNQLVAEGKPIQEAILMANRDRLRPILMTTITLVVAMAPVALAGPTGAQRAPMAMVVVGGQSLCLLLTLLVVPVFTSCAESFKAFLRRFKRRPEGPGDPA